ncbi:TrmH family RNA methyltransferase [Flavitalea sp.]|nr:RNA methyltransferase [Flavitalea sp.]
MLIKSQVKYIQSLSQKKFRDDEGLFVAEGPKIINDLLAGNQVLMHSLFATEEWLSANRSVLPASASSVTHTISHQELERISFLTTPNEVLAIFRKPLFEFPSNSVDSLILLLDNIQDPGNLGTIIRCADWFGIRHVICSPGSADQFSPKVVQSTMASIARVGVHHAALASFLEARPGTPVYAAALEGKSLDQYKSVDRGILVIGNESKGISSEVMAFATECITIPRRGKAESLNAAVATGIILSHLVG